MFSKIIEKGKVLFELFLDSKSKIFDGVVVFNLLEIYGFFIELIVEILY